LVSRENDKASKAFATVAVIRCPDRTMRGKEPYLLSIAATDPKGSIVYGKWEVTTLGYAKRKMAEMILLAASGTSSHSC
jgi:hypothetical protein